MVLRQTIRAWLLVAIFAIRSVAFCEMALMTVLLVVDAVCMPSAFMPMHMALIVMGVFGADGEVVAMGAAQWAVT